MVTRSRIVVVAGCLGLILVAAMRERQTASGASSSRPALGLPRTATTSRADLDRTVKSMKARLQEDPGDAAAAVAMADALLRQTRVMADPVLAVAAEQALRRVLSINRSDYDARRMLATALLSQHRFREAIAEAQAARDLRAGDDWNEGVIGDAHLELGEYDEAFAAFDRMMSLRPGPAAYARASYARELQGDLDAAQTFMEMAREATPANDPESQAWHDVQLGDLHLAHGRADQATYYFKRAEFVFNDYPPAAEGLVKAHMAGGEFSQALAIALKGQDRFPTPMMAVQAGDLLTKLGRATEAESHYLLAEQLWRYEPAALAQFLADRGRDVPRAVVLAQTAASQRRDIFTDDALAWSLFKAGRATEAAAASRRALRTGTRDARILAHAAAISAAADSSSF